MVRDSFEFFKKFEIDHVPREPNFRANLLSKLANSKKVRFHCTVIQETLAIPNIEA